MNLHELGLRARDENVLSMVLLELTYACNLDCSFCYNDLALRGRRVPLERYLSLLDELADMGVLWLTLSGGEPLLYPKFFELGAYARSKGFVVKVKTNGVPVNRRNAERLKAEVDPFLIEMSLHGAQAETHDRLTQVPGSFERMLDNIEFLQSLGMKIHLNCTLTRLNEDEVTQMYALADRLGVRLNISPEVTPRDNGDLAPLDLTASREGVTHMLRTTLQRAAALRDRDTLVVNVKAPDEPDKQPASAGQKACGAGSTNLTIDPFGNVYPCVQFRRKVGNIHEQTIGEMWNGSGVLKEVRDLAGQALQVAQKQGLKHICMGVNELSMGDPLVSPPTKLESLRTRERLEWEINGQQPDAS
jgi:radical SAM protein with 4Fe4S-binding SPASM domain